MLLTELSRSRMFDPLSEIDRIHDQLSRAFFRPNNWRSPDFPSLNVWVGDESVVITAAVPGVPPEEIEVSVVNDILTIKGERKAEQEGDNQPPHRQERAFGAFSRTVQLPFRVDSDKVGAELKHGILRLELPRAEQDKLRKISVRTD